MWNVKTINTDMPLYLAITDAIERDIRTGVLKPGEKMPTHRELGKIIGVNVSTITKAYKQAEKIGLITSTVGSGTFVSSDLGLNSSLLNTEKANGELIEMGLTLPLYCAEPDLKDIILKVVNQSNVNMFMRYISPNGLQQHREIGAEWVRQYGITAGAENIIITAGAQHAILCILSSLFNQGDKIAVDCLTYPGVKTAAKRLGLRLAGIAIDDEGMIPQSLESACKNNEIKGIYTVSDMQNPTNAKMSESRLREIAEIIERYDLILIEDDLYRFLSDNPANTLTSLIPDRSIYIGGLSKAFYTGLRISFVVSPKQYYSRISQAVVDTIWMASQLNAEIVCKCIETGIANKIIRLKRQELKKRAELFCEKMVDFTYSYSPYSMFVWLTLPKDWSSYEFEKTANSNGINIVTANKFVVGNIMPPNCIRVSLSGTESLAEFEKGLNILKNVLNREFRDIENITNYVL